jgi:hypothetical protein
MMKPGVADQSSPYQIEPDRIAVWSAIAGDESETRETARNPPIDRAWGLC